MLDFTKSNLIPNRVSYLRKGDSKLKQLYFFRPHLVIEIFIKLLIQHKTTAGIFEGFPAFCSYSVQIQQR